MQLSNLDAITQSYRHIYLSPHLDDAALSCGGAIALQREAGEPVLVVTLCTAAPAPDAAFSDLAREFHSQWDLAPAEVVAARLREEQAAIGRLDADLLWAGMLDAIYRHPQAYHSRATLFAEPAPDDPLFVELRAFIAALRERAPAATFYGPLGVGSHVDHLITHQAAIDTAGAQLVFYEDFPYVARPGAIETRLAALQGPWRPRTIAIDRTLSQKIVAIEAYSSQLNELFGGVEAMARAVAEYGARVRPDGAAYGERLWSR
jgi:LmbE family N-acetylglucosaminyl deacetylase